MQSNWQILQAYKDLQANIKPLEQEVALEEIITHFTWQLEEWATEEELRKSLYEIVVFVRFLEIEFNKCHEKTWKYDWCEAFELNTMKWFDSLYHYFLSAYHSDKSEVLMSWIEYLKEFKDIVMKTIMKSYKEAKSDWDLDKHFNYLGKELAKELRRKLWIQEQNPQ